MRRASFLVPLCVFNCIGVVIAICNVDKHERGSGDRLQCSNVSLDTVLNETSIEVPAIMIFNSNLRQIPPRAFAKYAGSLQSLSIHKCQIGSIHADAFDSLFSLKKLSLPNNNIKEVKEEWFKDLAKLEQLDLSFNQIDRIQPVIFSKLLLLKRLDVRENRLTCLNPSTFPGGIGKVYFSKNPLSFQCRGKLTLWMQDHGVSYETELREKESWLDKLLWLCAIGNADVAKSEILMKECLILNLFNQLRTGLSTAEFYPLTLPRECVDARKIFTSCIATQTRTYDHAFTNGNVIKRILQYLQQTKSAL